MTARLPIIGGDDDTWGQVLNTFLETSHNGDGTLQTGAIQQAGGVTKVNGKSPSGGSLTLAASDVGAVQLGGDLGGTSASPTVESIQGVAISGTPSSGKALVAGSSSAASWTALTGSLLNDRGAIQASTQYNPGDVVAYQGQRVLITTATQSTAWTHWYTPPTLTAGTYIPITSEGMYYAADWGVVADGKTDNSGALNKALQFMYRGANAGGFLILPAGYDVNTNFVGVSNPVIIPPNCFIVGQGIQVSAIKLLNGANCDVIQFMAYNDSAQTTILNNTTGIYVTPTSLRNAYYAGLMHLTIDGARAGQSASSYNYGINMTTSPYNTEAPTDSSFDPTNFLFNVEVTECTGDGLYHYGRGQLRITNCIFRINNGWGAVTSFDSLYTGNNFGFNGLGGIYINYGACDGAANKSYNNGNNAQWVSGTTYAKGTAVMYNGAMYRSINAMSNDTTAPSSDTTNWAALTATAPYGWGVGFYFDSNASEDSWVACDGQQNMASDYYLNQYAHSITLLGQSASPWYTSNPNYNASVVLNGATGCLVDVAFSGLANLGYVLRIVNGAAQNDVRMVGDTSYAAILSPDTMTLSTSTNAVRVNGTTLSAPGLPLLSGATFTGNIAAPAVSASGLTGATAASRYVGGTTSGAPTTGTFVVGDYVIDQTAKIWICTTTGTPGTWTQISSGSSNVIDGVTVSGTPVAGNALTATSATTANWQTPAAGVTLDTTSTDIHASGTQAAGSTGKAADAGHTHPENSPWIPSDNGFIAVNFDPAFAVSTGTMSAGVLYLQKLTIHAAVTITNLWWSVQAGGAGTSSGSYCGLYSSSGTLLSGSSDVGSLMTSSATVSQALTTPQVLSAGTFVWAALLVNLATTQPTLWKTGAPAGAVNANLTTSTARTAANGTGQTSLPSSIALSNNNLGYGFVPWMGAS